MRNFWKVFKAINILRLLLESSIDTFYLNPLIVMNYKAVSHILMILFRPFRRKAGSNPESFSRDGKKRVDSYIRQLAQHLNLNKVFATLIFICRGIKCIFVRPPYAYVCRLAIQVRSVKFLITSDWIEILYNVSSYIKLILPYFTSKFEKLRKSLRFCWMPFKYKFKTTQVKM